MTTYLRHSQILRRLAAGVVLCAITAVIPAWAGATAFPPPRSATDTGAGPPPAIAAAPTAPAEELDITEPTITLVGGEFATIAASSLDLQFSFNDNVEVLTAYAYYQGRLVPMVDGLIRQSSLREGTGTLSLLCIDTSGNTALWTRQMVVDRTAPTLTNTVAYVLEPTATFGVYDEISGAVREDFEIATPAIGRRTRNLRLRDRLGNQRVQQVEYTRALSLADPAKNADLKLRDNKGRLFTPTGRDLNRAFAYRADLPHWFARTSRTAPIVRQLQIRLHLLRYLPRRHPVTGLMDIETMKAVRRFQRAYGVTPSATVGPKTRRLLDEALLERNR